MQFWNFIDSRLDIVYYLRFTSGSRQAYEPLSSTPFSSISRTSLGCLRSSSPRAILQYLLSYLKGAELYWCKRAQAHGLTGCRFTAVVIQWVVSSAMRMHSIVQMKSPAHARTEHLVRSIIATTCSTKKARMKMPLLCARSHRIPYCFVRLLCSFSGFES